MKEEVGKRLREMRRLKRLTQKALAEIVGVDYTYIGKIERAEQLPSLSVLIKIADSLSIPLDRFFVDNATFRLLNLIPKTCYATAGRKELWELLRLLEGVDTEDIPLLVEIVKVLKKHRGIKGSQRLPMVAETQEGYKRK